MKQSQAAGPQQAREQESVRTCHLKTKQEEACDVTHSAGDSGLSSIEGASVSAFCAPCHALLLFVHSTSVFSAYSRLIMGQTWSRHMGCSCK